MNKCDGIKILELDPKRILEGNEYMVIAEKVIAMNENGTIYNDSISTAFRYGYVAGNSEKRGQQFIRSYVSSRDGQAADEEFAVVNYFDKTEAGQVVALNPIT